MSTRWLPLATLLVSSTAAIADSKVDQSAVHPEDGTSAIVGGETVPRGALAGHRRRARHQGLVHRHADRARRRAHRRPLREDRADARDREHDRLRAAGGIRVNVTRTTAYPNWQNDVRRRVIVAREPDHRVDAAQSSARAARSRRRSSRTSMSTSSASALTDMRGHGRRTRT